MAAVLLLGVPLGAAPATQASAVAPPRPPAFERGDFPGPGSTGVPVGRTLTPMPGRVITVPGTVIDSRLVRGTLTIAAPGVVIRNSRIVDVADDHLGIYVRSGSAAIVRSEVIGFETGIAGDHWTARRVDLARQSGDGVKFGDGVRLLDSWIHDARPGPGDHFDGGQLQSGVTDLIVRHNTIEVGRSANSALFLAPDLGPSTAGPVLIEDNLLSGGGYTMFCVDGADGAYVVHGITVRRNYFGENDFGPARVNVPVAWSGNLSTSGRPVPLPR